MKEYAVISGSSVICIVKARSLKAASKKAISRLAKEYEKVYNIKILKVACRPRKGK